MKIALVIDDTLDKTDGAQQVVLALGSWLRHHGHVVHYLVADTKRTDIPNVHSLGRFVSLRLNKNNVRTPLPASKAKIKALMDREQFDVVHVAMPYSPLLGELVIRSIPKSTALIGSFHTHPASNALHQSHKVLSLVLARTLKRFDYVTAPSEATVHFARKAYGLVTHYLPNPIILKDFSSGKPLKAYDRKKLNIVFLGRLVRRKGVLELIKAYNAISEESAEKTRLIIGGKGPFKDKAKSLVKTGRDVTFAGFVSEKDKADFLASADIAVFPSTAGEAFGNVLVEAMAAGAGVVLGGDNPGYHGVLGAQPYLLFNPSDINAFSEHLEMFINDAKLRERMHEWQATTVGQYGISVIGENLTKIYTDVLHERKEVRQ